MRLRLRVLHAVGLCLRVLLLLVLLPHGLRDVDAVGLCLRVLLPLLRGLRAAIGAASCETRGCQLGLRAVRGAASCERGCMRGL